MGSIAVLIKVWKANKRYAGLGVLAYNLHRIGQRLIEKQRPKKTIKCFSV